MCADGYQDPGPSSLAGYSQGHTILPVQTQAIPTTTRFPGVSLTDCLCLQGQGAALRVGGLPGVRDLQQRRTAAATFQCILAAGAQGMKAVAVSQVKRGEDAEGAHTVPECRFLISFWPGLFVTQDVNV